MKPTMTELHLWKVWLTFADGMAQPPKWWVHVLARSAAVATPMAEEWMTAWWNDGSQAVAVSVMLLADSIVWDGDAVPQALATGAAQTGLEEQLAAEIEVADAEGE